MRYGRQATISINKLYVKFIMCCILRIIMSELFSSNKIQHVTRENEEKRANDRKKHLLYLISSYLFENGFFHSCESLVNEAQLAGNMEVCDNIDLDIILQEYSNYYQVKFKKPPKFCKKVAVEETAGRVPAKPASTKSSSSVRSTRSLGGGGGAAAKRSETSNKCELSPFTVTPLLQEGVSAAGDNRTQHDIAFLEYAVLRPLYDFPGFNNEWKELAEMVSKEIIARHLHVKWEDIKGLADAKNLLREAVEYPLKYPRLFSKIPVPWKGILLYGPPGTGKTFLAKALASCCEKNTFFNMSASSLISKWRGESEKLVRVLFELAKFQEPSTVFIDEIDALGSKRDECQHDASRRFKSELLIQMDGLSTGNERVFLLATSNLPWEIDQAILRRFEKRILIDFPDAAAREEMFRHYLREMVHALQISDEEFVKFAELTAGYTGSDIKMICKEAAIIPLRKEIAKHSNEIYTEMLKPLWAEEVITAIENTQPTAKQFAEKYYKWHKDFGCI